MTISKFEFIQVEPTNRCNFKCSFCCGRHQIQGDMAPATLHNILQYFDDCKVLQLQGEGEPLLHPDFFEFAGLAREKGIGVSIVTNGSLLHENNVQRIIETGIERIDCSIDSADSKIYAELRGFELEKTIAGIENLVRLKSKLRLAKPAIGLSVIVMRKTMNSIMDLVRLYRELHLDGSINFQPLQGLEAYSRYYTHEMMLQMLSGAEIDQLKKTYGHNPELQAVFTKQNPVREFFIRLGENVDTAAEGCPWLVRGLYVNFEGYTLPCSVVKDARRFSFGRIGFEAKELIIQARSRMNQDLLRGNTPEACKDCNIAKSICQKTVSECN